MIKARRSVKPFIRRIRQRGQGMTEYIIIVALIGVAAIGVYALFRQTIRNQTAGLASELAGNDAQQNINKAQANAQQATTQADAKKNLANYNEQNH
jgi:Tfp pilus assembly protein PilV